MKRKKGWLPVFLLPAVALFLLIYAVPLVIVFVSSLFDYRLTGDSMTFIGLQNYTQLFSDATFRQACGHTVVWILIHCIIHVSIGVILALVLYKKPRGWKFVRTAYMIPNIISNAAMGMIFLNIFNPQYGVVNSILKAVGLESLTHNWLMDTTTAFPSVTMTWLLFAGYTTTLVLAEALTIDDSVLEAINRVRARVNMPPVTDRSREGLRKALRYERKAELCNEGFRWFDIRRLWNDPLFQDDKKNYTHKVGEQTYTLTEDRLTYRIPPKVMSFNRGWVNNN